MLNTTSLAKQNYPLGGRLPAQLVWSTFRVSIVRRIGNPVEFAPLIFLRVETAAAVAVVVAVEVAAGVVHPEAIEPQQLHTLHSDHTPPAFAVEAEMVTSGVANPLAT
jgi:hypothetical protein